MTYDEAEREFIKEKSRRYGIENMYSIATEAPKGMENDDANCRCHLCELTRATRTAAAEYDAVRATFAVHWEALQAEHRAVLEKRGAWWDAMEAFSKASHGVVIT